MALTPLMKGLSLLGVVLLMMSGTACIKKKGKVRVPLALDSTAKPLAITLTEQGTEAYQGRAFEEAKKYFSQAVTAAPESGAAHYNYALALNALGESEQARKHFIEAANWAPGDKVIWDSPPLAPYGNPEVEEKVNTGPPQNLNRRGIGGRYP